jgi:hypothetical protein
MESPARLLFSGISADMTDDAYLIPLFLSISGRTGDAEGETLTYNEVAPFMSPCHIRPLP